jgi:hypothetical protein
LREREREERERERERERESPRSVLFMVSVCVYVCLIEGCPEFVCVFTCEFYWCGDGGWLVGWLVG